MKTLVIDIETCATREERIIAAALAGKDEEKRAEIMERLALSPTTGMVACVAVLNPETDGFRIFSPRGVFAEPFVDKPIGEMAMGESGMLLRFWATVAGVERIVTWNGRGFDIPFLLARSLALGVKISRDDLMGNRYRTTPHCDLYEQITGYGSLRTHSLSLGVVCAAMGIESPKSEITGADVDRMYHAGEHQRIAEYCLGDVRATAELYKRWVGRMA